MLKYWITKNEEKILIKDMTTQHIKNCIKAIEENRISVGQTINLGYTGDGDGDGIIYDFIDYGEQYIKAFKNELERRSNGRRKNTKI